MAIRYSVFGFLFLTTLACSRGVSTAGSPPDPRSSAQAEESRIVTGRSWMLIPDPTPRQYTSTTVTTIDLPGDSATLQDLVTLRTRFTISLSPSGSHSVSLVGSINEIAATAGSRIGPSLEQAFLPFRISGRVTSGRLTLDSVAGRPVATVSDCSNPALTVVPVIHRTIVVTPSALTTGQAWNDSTSATVCSGMVPVTLVVARNYLVLGEVSRRGLETILVERADRTSFTGEGAQAQHRIIITGSGTGVTRLYLNSESGQLVESEGEYRSDLTVMSSGRQQKFRQTVREAVFVEPFIK